MRGRARRTLLRSEARWQWQLPGVLRRRWGGGLLQRSLCRCVLQDLAGVSSATRHPMRHPLLESVVRVQALELLHDPDDLLELIVTEDVIS